MTGGAPAGGLSENPSRWSARLPLMVLALLGFFVAGYLTLVQEGVFASAWDPFFGDGSDRVLHSSFSESLPFSDAGLGAFTYLVEIGLGSIGGSYRWRRLPWAALAFEAVLVGAAVAGLGLVLVQATVVHRFCTLCLTSTAISVLILACSRLREARAAVRAILARHAEGVSWLDALLGEPVDRLPALAKQERLAEARALMAAVCTVAAGAALSVVALFSYGLSGASLDAVWRDSFLGVLLVGFGLAGCVAPVAAVRSAVLQVLAGIGLLVTVGLSDGSPSGHIPVVWWMDVAVGLIAIACGVARLVTSGWARHVAHLRGPVSTLQGR